MKLKENIQAMKSYVQHNKKKFIISMCCFVVVGGMVAATLAWLSSKTNPVINNFIGSNLVIDLEETANEFQMIPGKYIAKDPKITVEANSEACWLFLQIKESPAQANGSGLTKTQEGQSTTRTTQGVDSYKFLHYEVLTGTNEFDGWTLLNEEQVTDANFPKIDPDGSVNTYYYRKVGEDGAAIPTDIEFMILKEFEDDQDPNQISCVQVNEWIINDELNDWQESGYLSQNPVTITFTPIAVQRLGFNLSDAGQEIAGQFTVSNNQ